MPQTLRERPRRNVWRDALWLTVFCAVVYMLGMTTHGLTNWQESQRALVAREMFAKNEWIVPTVHGEPYIAKPPLIYWVQMVIAHGRVALGAEPFGDETEIRLTVALGGMAGVLATYFAARWMFGGGRRREGAGAWPGLPMCGVDGRVADDAAWLSALGLAVGMLYVRSSRIGELDVLIVPFVVIAVAAITAAYRAWLERGSPAGLERGSPAGRGVHWGALAVATVAGCGAALAKGPPALLVVAMAAYGSVVLHAAMSARREDDQDQADEAQRAAIEARRTEVTLVAALLGAIALPVIALMFDDRVRSFWHAMGLVFFALVGAAIAAGAVALTRHGRARAVFFALQSTHPLIVLGVPALVVWGWTRMVGARVGTQTVAALASIEVEDNLRLLVLDSPTKNLGFMIYGIAPMSVVAIVGAWCLLRRRMPGDVGTRVPLVWCGLSFVAFSMLGKGVARYLTPVWPGVAMVGGLWLAMLERERARRGLMPVVRVATVVLVVCGVAQGLWYGVMRERMFGARSPRDVVRELAGQVDVTRLGTWRLDDPAIDFYARERIERWGERDGPDFDAMVREVRGGAGAYTLLATNDAAVTLDTRTPLAIALREAGIDATPIDLSARYAWRADGAPVMAWSLVAR